MARTTPAKNYTRRPRKGPHKGPRTLQRLSPRRIESLREIGRHPDGGNLYFVVTKSGKAKWTFMYRRRGSGGQVVEMGLGSYPAITLAAARNQAAAARTLLASGRDPLEERNGERNKAAETKEIPTFGETLNMLIASRESGWRNAKHRQQWRNSVTQHAPKLMRIPVDEVTTDDVLGAVEPIWASKSETASRVRNRIENTLDYAKSRGFRSGENPARWRGHLQHILPKRRRLTRGHFASMPYEDVPAFVARLRRSQSVSTRAMEVLILCALRTSEVTGAEWREICLESAIWTIPAARMKGSVELRVPLPPRVVSIFRELAAVKRGPHVFVGNKRNKPLSNMALESVLRKMGAKPSTTHGFRSAFRTWAAEKTKFPREVAEACLAHAIAENAVEAAYLRTTLFDERRRLIVSWARFMTMASQNDR